MTAKPKILVVDDDRSICKLMGSILEMESYPFRLATSGEQARRAIEEESFDILVSDIYLGDDSGLTLLERMKSVNADAEVVIMTAHGSMETAVRAVHNGAFDYISKPFVVDEILAIIHRIEEKFRLVQASADGKPSIESFPDTEMIGTSPKMVDIYKKVAKISRIEAPVLVVGESGSGKELVARALHANSARRTAPFIVINCGALTETLLESELFGHERGSFTGATAPRNGLLESGAGGTVFLDEISYTWPGNVRELKNMLERATTCNDTGVIQVDELEFGEQRVESSSGIGLRDVGGSFLEATVSQSMGSLDQMEKDHIIKVLRETGGN